MRTFFVHGRSLLRSIASLPALIFLIFVGISCVQLAVASDGYTLPDALRRLDLRDLDTIRTSLAAVITGVFTLTIFAYTMIMNVLDRSISSYSPRLLPLILAERYHQEILGVGAGTIAHSTILLLGVAAPPEAVQPPPLAVASASFFAVSSLILFIYFIHRVSRSIHVNALLYKSYRHTASCLGEQGKRSGRLSWSESSPPTEGDVLLANRCGYLNAVDFDGLLRRGGVTEVVVRPGAFVYFGDPLFRFRSGHSAGGSLEAYYAVSENEPIDVAAVGFKHLVEVAIKAASPALNDPATSLTAIHYLVQLFELWAGVGCFNTIEIDGRTLRINAWSPQELIETTFAELRRYLSDDPWGRASIGDGLKRIERAFQAAGNQAAAATARLELARLTGQGT
ncbi:putative membrane protein [Neolewinella xylanilytica]|uniref:Putative membrane protein n=1 Tax=Neolewinella xylanilytica TaxID=1514080 RepID=A0A2S6I4W0_9BACT|nr:DUF2254 family protein [Neolewinella xylanilytica]PPK86192.1 putative membrane protein [Neolewinella xylanilytica]